MLSIAGRTVACGVLAIVAWLPASAQPAAVSRTVAVETLRFTAPVALPGITLRAGDYTFEVERRDHVELVRVREGRSDRIVFDGPARPADRPRGLKANKSIVFGEAPSDRPQPIVAWFPRDRVVGYEFDYAPGPQ